jgi:hypothetical protein
LTTFHPTSIMPMLEHVPSGYQAATATATSKTGVHLQSNSGDFIFTFDALRPGLFRTSFTSPKHLLPPHRATPVPDKTLDDTKTTLVPSNATSKSLAIDGINAAIDWESGVPIVSLTLPGQKTPIHADLPNRSYVADGPGVSHYTRYNNGTLHLGLGEKPAPMDLSNRHFVLSATDSFGYDVYRTDPMYKHIPVSDPVRTACETYTDFVYLHLAPYQCYPGWLCWYLLNIACSRILFCRLRDGWHVGTFQSLPSGLRWP